MLSLRQSGMFSLLAVGLLGCPCEDYQAAPPGVMVSVSSSSFNMGNPWDDPAGDGVYVSEHPIHRVTLSGFEIGVYEVTNQEYSEILSWAYGRGYFAASSDSAVVLNGRVLIDVADKNCQIAFEGDRFVPKERDGLSMALFPVVEVSWFGTLAYCNWLSEISGYAPCYDLNTWERIDPLTNGYRLPTEAEWERSAAWDGSRHWRYAFLSDSITTSRCNYWETNPFRFGSPPKTTPIGYYSGLACDTVNSSSPVGAYDMSGNVQEWCQDWYSLHYYSASSAQDPVGPDSGAMRVTRGGSWSDDELGCRCADRYFMQPDSSNEYVGFRVARSL